MIVVGGTGTGIGKTHLACALALAWGEVGPTATYKPVETGVPEGARGEDAERLDEVATFHVKHARRWTFVQPLTPARASRLEGRPLDLAEIVAAIRAVDAEAPRTVVELPGGLFSPLTARATAADVIRALDTPWVLVAPNRLGVLHDVLACIEGRTSLPLPIAILLSRPEGAAAESNAEELRRWTPVPVHSLPDAPVQVLARSAELRGLVRTLAPDGGA